METSKLPRVARVQRMIATYLKNKYEAPSIIRYFSDKGLEFTGGHTEFNRILRRDVYISDIKMTISFDEKLLEIKSKLEQIWGKKNHTI